MNKMTQDFHTAFEKATLHSSTVDELELLLASEGQFLNKSCDEAFDILLIAMGFLDRTHCDAVSRQLDKVDRYNHSSWLPSCQKLLVLFDSICKNACNEKDFAKFCRYATMWSMMYSGRGINAVDKHEQMFHSTFLQSFDDDVHDEIASMFLDAVLKYDNDVVLHGDELTFNNAPILIDMLNFMHITTDYIKLAEGFRSAFSKEIALSTELYDTNVFLLQKAKSTLEVLIKYGADPNAKNRVGISFNDIVNIDDVFNKEFDDEYKNTLYRNMQSMFMYNSR